MGLDFSNNNAHWAYGGFHAFRKHVASSIGIDLDSMVGFIKDDNSGISWNTVSDPIKFLLDHSDCDGKLSVKECKLIAPRLREIIETWGESPEEIYDKQQALILANGMDEAVQTNRPLRFQ